MPPQAAVQAAVAATGSIRPSQDGSLAGARSTTGAGTEQRRRVTGMVVYHASEKDCIGEDGEESQECIICFEEFSVGEEMGRLECLCKFHKVRSISLVRFCSWSEAVGSGSRGSMGKKDDGTFGLWLTWEILQHRLVFDNGGIPKAWAPARSTRVAFRSGIHETSQLPTSGFRFMYDFNVGASAHSFVHTSVFFRIVSICMEGV